MAVAVIDEEEGAGMNFDAPVADQEEAKKRIKALLEDKKIKEDYYNRLDRKLKTLEGALASQRDEVESLQRTLKQEQDKDSLDNKSRQVEREQKTAKQEERIRNTLSNVLYRKAPPRPGKKNDSRAFELDTVLISFIRPNENIRYNLPFRVDSSTTLKHLRDDACKYWDVSTEEFILKTMGNSKCQNEIMVQECFKQGEIAQLRLEFKNKEQSSVTEAEYKAIAPKKQKGGRSNKDKADQGADSVLRFNDRFTGTLKKMGGVYFLLKLRDLKPSEHVNKIKPRDFCIYLFLGILTFLVYFSQRLPGEDYWLMRGVQDSLFVSVPKPASAINFNVDTSAHVPEFRDLTRFDDVWDWLQISLPHILWRNSSDGQQSINTYNTMKGYLSIRQKTLKEPSPVWLHCDKFKTEVASLEGTPSAACPSVHIEEKLEETADKHFEGLKRYWDYHLNQDKASDFVRGPALPWKFVNAADNSAKHNIGDIYGNLQKYDAGGYTVEYRATLPTLAGQENLAFYRKDMREFRQKNWINNLTTRAVFVGFNVYNYHYDTWVSVSLTIELPPSGVIVPTYEIRPFIPNLFETANEYSVSYFLFLRLLIAMYILFVVGVHEMRHKTRNQKAGYKYYLSLNGICDVSISVCIVITIGLRFALFNPAKTQDLITEMEDVGKTFGFTDFAEKARQYEWLYVLEGFIFGFTMIRLISLFRINRTIYLLWHTLGHAMKQGIYLCLLFMPTFLFFTFASHRIWGSDLKSFHTLSQSFISVYHMTNGYTSGAELARTDTWLAAFFYTMLYIFVTFLLTCGFATVFVEAYYVVQLTATASGEKFGAEKMKTWLVHPVLLSLFHFAIQGQGQVSHQIVSD